MDETSHTAGRDTSWPKPKRRGALVLLAICVGFTVLFLVGAYAVWTQQDTFGERLPASKRAAEAIPLLFLAGITVASCDVAVKCITLKMDLYGASNFSFFRGTRRVRWGDVTAIACRSFRVRLLGDTTLVFESGHERFLMSMTWFGVDPAVVDYFVGLCSPGLPVDPLVLTKVKKNVEDWYFQF